MGEAPKTNTETKKPTGLRRALDSIRRIPDTRLARFATSRTVVLPGIVIAAGFVSDSLTGFGWDDVWSLIKGSFEHGLSSEIAQMVHDPKEIISWEDYNKIISANQEVGTVPIDQLSPEEQANFDALSAKHDAQIREFVFAHLGRDIDAATLEKIKEAGGFIEPDGTKVQLFYNGHSPLGGVSQQIVPADMKVDYPQLDADGKVVEKPAAPPESEPEKPASKPNMDTKPAPTAETPKTAEVAVELPDANRNALLVATAQLGDLKLSAFAAGNPHPAGSALYSAWDTVYTTLKSMPEDWKTSSMTLSQFWTAIGLVK